MTIKMVWIQRTALGVSLPTLVCIPHPVYPLGDLTLVEKKFSPEFLFRLSMTLYFIASLATLPLLFAFKADFIYVYVLGVLLSVFYTANPIGLKYMALGDVTIFLCFGPLLMTATSILISGKVNTSLLPYALPIGMLTEAILHANNTRDMKNDYKANLVTLAILLGPRGSYLFYLTLILGAYLAVALLAWYYSYACFLCLLTAPLAYDLIGKFGAFKFDNIVEETAKFHLPFGLLLFLGVMISDKGLSQLI